MFKKERKMNRVEKLRFHIDEILFNINDNEERRCAYVHLYGVAQYAALLALKRGEDAELATMAGMLHDIYTYAKSDSKEHAHKGAILARKILSGLDITTSDETDKICNAIYNHSDKKTIHSDFDELLKDADVMQHILYNTSFDIYENEVVRYEKLKKEFQIYT